MLLGPNKFVRTHHTNTHTSIRSPVRARTWSSCKNWCGEVHLPSLHSSFHVQQAHDAVAVLEFAPDKHSCGTSGCDKQPTSEQQHKPLRDECTIISTAVSSDGITWRHADENSVALSCVRTHLQNIPIWAVRVFSEAMTLEAVRTYTCLGVRASTPLSTSAPTLCLCLHK